MIINLDDEGKLTHVRHCLLFIWDEGCRNAKKAADRLKEKQFMENLDILDTMQILIFLLSKWKLLS